YFVAILITAALLFGCAKVVARYWDWLLETDGQQREARLRSWFCKAVPVPVLIWLWFNFGLAPGHVATMPDVVVAKLSGEDWVYILCQLALPAALVAGSYWAAMTLVWLVVH